MKFRQAPVDPRTGYLSCVVSENSRWELGIYPVIFGYRVRGGLRGGETVDIDYCAASQPAVLAELFLTMIVIMEQLPEEVEPWQVSALLPGFTRRPINQDPICWEALQHLSRDQNALNEILAAS